MSELLNNYALPKFALEHVQHFTIKIQKDR